MNERKIWALQERLDRLWYLAYIARFGTIGDRNRPRGSKVLSPDHLAMSVFLTENIMLSREALRLYGQSRHGEGV